MAEEQQAKTVPKAQDVAAPGEQQAAAAAAGAEQLDGDQTGQMSKNQMKKLKKRQYYEEKKQQRKQVEKQQKQAEQERRRTEGRQRMAGMTEEEQQKWREERNARGVARKQERDEGKAKMEKALESGQRIVLDLDFADLMRDNELKSICGQLAYCWHANCGAQHPAHLVLTGMQGKMEEVMVKQGKGFVNWKATITPKSYLEHFADSKDKLVYLTADSENELQELDPAAIYIIGGIVDRNRHKKLCLSKAEEQGIAHARLPIGPYMQLASSQVMTTNHVVDIMLRWLELKDWKKAFETVIPNRKRKQEDGEEQEEEQEGEGGAGGEGEKQEEQQQADKQQVVGSGDGNKAQGQQAAASGKRQQTAPAAAGTAAAAGAQE